jgi:hypothetical protein
MRGLGCGVWLVGKRRKETECNAVSGYCTEVRRDALEIRPTFFGSCAVRVKRTMRFLVDG